MNFDPTRKERDLDARLYRILRQCTYVKFSILKQMLCCSDDELVFALTRLLQSSAIEAIPAPTTDPLNDNFSPN
jgi:hypothetical protein